MHTLKLWYITLVVRAAAAHVEEDLQIRQHLLEALLDDAHLILARPARGQH